MSIFILLLKLLFSEKQIRLARTAALQVFDRDTNVEEDIFPELKAFYI